MNAKTAFAVAAVFCFIVTSLIDGSPAWAAGESVSDATFTALVCASGYHLGPHGNCQPKYHPGRRCQHGYTSEPFPNGNGYRCVPKGY